MVDGRLISKLPFSYQNLWDDHSTLPGATHSGSEWHIFQAWLTRQREIALSAKKRSMQLTMGTEVKQPISSNTSDKGCHKCGQVGHFARNCRSPATSVRKFEEVLLLKAGQMTSKKDFEDALPELKSKAGSCKIC